jgi:hypothetical protein
VEHGGFIVTKTGYNMKKRIVCIDLDGTICHYNEWKDESHFGDLIPGTLEAVTELKNDGWIIIIYTTRTNIDLIEKYLRENSIQFDYINKNPFQPENALGGKPYADVYIDDRAIQFNGDWEVVKREVEIFQPWEKRKFSHIDKTKHSEEFLNHDFDQSYQQLRHYDSLNWDITKFSFIQLLVGISATWAVYGFAHSLANSDTIFAKKYNLIIPSILGISYVFSILASFLISRNRVYYSKVARYINEHRKFSLSVKPLGFNNITEFYTNTSFPPAFDIWSTHLVSLYVVQVISGIMFSAIVFSLASIFNIRPFWCYILGFSFGIVSILANLFVFVRYMKKQDNQFGKCLL